MTTPDLVSRLLEAIAETERLAREAASSFASDSGEWEADDAHPRRMPRVLIRGRHFVVVQDLSDEFARHIAHNDPSSVLRRCAADRVIVQQHQPAPVVEEGDPPNCGVCIEPGYIGLEFCCDWPRVPWPCPTLRATMSAYGLSDQDAPEVP